LRYYAISRKIVGSIPDEAIKLFSIFLIFSAALWPWVDSASNKKEYQKIVLENNARPVRKAKNFTDICEPIV
jgi:hypothetical protein